MRIHFSRGDLARTSVAAGPDPMWELVNSLQMLQGRYGRTVFDPWRREVTDRLHQSHLAEQVRARLFPIAPHAAYFPDLLTPPEAALGVDEGIETILSTPRPRLGAELSLLNPTPGAASWLADLGVGRAKALTALGDTLRGYHHNAIAPYWSRLRVWIDNDLALRRQATRDGGVERLLTTFRPMMRWQPPILELRDHPSDRDVHLDGRGLLLIPSYFCWQHPITIFDPNLPQIVVYPVDHDVSWLQTTSRRATNRPLARLLGDTRAAVLRAAHGGCTTSDLAHRLGMSPAAISHHIGILRDTGLIASQRTANTVHHTLTPLGAALLHDPRARPREFEPTFQSVVVSGS
jgi:DNA-binding transcriptional ArsR family regulator